MSPSIYQSEPRNPWAFSYGRQSHREAIDAGEAIPAQELRTRAYWEACLKPQGVDQFYFLPDESPVSARTNPFMLRHAGKSLMTLLRPGDHFIIDKVDRLWRSVEDFVDVRRMFEQRKIKLHIVNLLGASVQVGTPGGDFLLSVLVAGAQLESDQAADRTRARFAGRRAQGRYPGSRTPLGCRLIGELEKEKGRVVRDTRLYQWCPDKRRFMGELVRLADEEGMNCADIRRIFVRHFREFMGQAYFRRELAEANWPAFAISRYYWREKQYRALPEFDPNRIKFCIFDPPPEAGRAFRDIGRSEPETVNPYPFLDGRRIPTLRELLTGR